MRRRATSGEMARGGGGFCFFLWRLLRCRGGVGAGARGGFNPLRGATTGVVMRRRATSGEMARGGGVFVFFFGGCSGVGGEWEREHEGGLIRCAGRPREWSCGAVPPQERWHEGGWFLFFSWRLLRCRGGVGAGARGGFNPLRGATTGVVMRRRATSGEMARGGLVFVFSLEVAPVSKGDSFTR